MVAALSLATHTWLRKIKTLKPVIVYNNYAFAGGGGVNSRIQDSDVWSGADPRSGSYTTYNIVLFFIFRFDRSNEP